MSKQQRRKGNAKTASSAQAAELLASTGHAIPFIGFDGTSTLSPSFSEKALSELSFEEILPEARNALKKMTKKDALTREKGLKEMIEILNKMEVQQMEKCLPGYASAFPKLTLDGVLVVRVNSIRVLEIMIKTLQRSSERFMIKLLPYVVFAMHDSYAQVRQCANNLFTECFNDEKRRKAVAICLDPTCDIALQILERVHPLLFKGEGEETDDQRTCRLMAQSLGCLTSICERIASAERAEQIVQFLKNKQHLKQLMNTSPQVMGAVFALGKRLLSVDWAQGLCTQSGLAVAALSNLDNPDRTVCRSAAEYLILCFEKDNISDHLNINKAIIPKLISIVRKKENHWMSLQTRLTDLLKLVHDCLPLAEREPLMRRTLEAFFDGLPPDSSFGTNNWAAALIKTIKLALSDLENDDDNAECEEFVEYICSEVQKALDWSVKFDDKLTMRTIATLPFLILNADETLIPSKMMQQCHSYIFMTLFSRLPSSEIIIEELFNLSSSSHRDNTLMDFAEMILRSPSSSDALVAHIIGLYDDTQLIQINKSMPLAKTIADKIVWQTSQSTTTAKALLKAANATQTHFEDFLKLDDEMCCACLVESISANIEDYGVDSWLSQLTSSTVWEKMIDKAISKNLQSYECSRWQLVVNAVVKMTNREDVISRIVENEVAQSVEPFVDLMNTCSKTMIGEECRTKVATKALENIFESSNVSDEEIEKVVGAICSTVTAEDFIVDYIDRKLEEDNLRENCVDTALCLLRSMPSKSTANRILLSSERLTSQLSNLRNYDVEIITRNPFLTALLPSILDECSHSEYEKCSTLKEQKLPLKCMRRALFLMRYIESSADQIFDQTDTKFALSLLFAVSVQCLDEMEKRLEKRSLSSYEIKEQSRREVAHDPSVELSEKVTQIILLNENGRHMLLKCFVEFTIAENRSSIPLALMLAVRKVCDGLDLRSVKKELLLQYNDNTKELSQNRLCSIACSTTLVDAVDTCEWNVLSANDWLSRCELQCCASDPTNTLVLLTCFVCEARTSFENTLFIFQGTEKEGSNEMNALNCALLRVLRCSCVALDVMESGLRDFLLCALITALESCKLESKRDEYSQLFVIFASLTIQLFIECVRIAESTVDDTNFSVFRQEWDEFYRKPAEAILIEWFVSLCDRETSSMHPALLRVLSSSMHFCKETTFLTVELPSRFDVELDCKNYPEEMQSVVVPVLSLISHQMVEIQFAALRILRAITVDMTLLENKNSVEDDKGAGKVEVLVEEEVDADERSETPDEKKVLPVAILRLINDDINYSSEAANKVGIAPLLLAWDALVETMARFKVSDRKEYCDSSNMLCIIEIVIAKIFDILPDSIPNIDEILLDHSLFRMKQSSHLEFSLVSQYAIGLFYRTLTTLPALVRQLYTSLPRSFSSVLANYTSRYLSPIIWRSERLLISQQKLPPSLQVRVRSRAWEISAEYDMVDAKMALLISIPQDYPLSMPSFEYENAISNRELKNKWLLQLMLYFSSHNGSIMDGVLMWAGLVARHLDGVEDCMICMMTVHAKTLKLPRLKCGQCKKRFHVDCLRKWFETSRQSLCPLCRYNFRSYIKAFAKSAPTEQ